MTTDTKVSTWSAYATHEGYALHDHETDELSADELYDVRIVVARGTAAPREENEEDGPKMPDVYDGEDLIHETGDCETRDEFWTRYTQAKAMADGLNRAGL